MTHTDIPPGVYGMARRAFIGEINRQNMAATVETLQYSTEPYQPGPSLKAEVLDRTTSFMAAETNLRALLRPGLDEADVAETLARWMLYIAGASVNAEQLIKAMLTAATPEIEKAFAMRVDLEFRERAPAAAIVSELNPIKTAERAIWYAAGRLLLQAAGMAYMPLGEGLG